MICDQPTIVLVSANTGYGHTKAGKSLERELYKRLPSWRIVHENACDYSNLPKYINAEKIWSFLSTSTLFRPLYGLCHSLLVSNNVLAKVARLVFRGIGSRLHKQFAGCDVRAVIALHPGAAAACTFWKKRQSFLLSVVATDLVVHEFQAFKEIDQVFCDRKAVILVDRSRNSAFFDKICYSGLPVESEFFRVDRNRQHDEARTILFTFGAKGLRSIHHIRRFIEAIRETSRFRSIIVCGDNECLRLYTEKLVQKLNLQSKCEVLGFVDNMDELLSAADFVVGKPGGITTGELIASKKRAVILDYLPGQEEYNLEVLVAHGLAIYEPKGPLNSVLQEFSQCSDNWDFSFIDAFEACGVTVIADTICKSLPTCGKPVGSKHAARLSLQTQFANP